MDKKSLEMRFTGSELDLKWAYIRLDVETQILIARSVRFNIPAKIIEESTPSSYASARIAESEWLGR